MTFPSDHISEPHASVLPFVRVHDLLLHLRSLLHLLPSFGSVYNYSGIQRGKSVSMFLPFLVSFRWFIYLLFLPFPAFMCLSYPIIVRLCHFVSLRLDILLVF